MKKTLYFLSLVSFISINNHAQGMQRPLWNTSDITSPLSPVAHCFDIIPIELIEKIAACCDRKNTLIQLNKKFYSLCSKSNADRILTHDLLALQKFDRQYFVNYYAYEGNERMVINLLDNGAKLDYMDAFDMSPLKCAADGLNEKIINLLIKRGLKPFKSDTNLVWPIMTPLHKAAYYGKINTVKSLITLKTNVNNQDNLEQVTPLIIASYWGNTQIVQLLLENGANVHLTDEEDYTPLHYACLNGHFGIAQLLLKYDADVAVIDEDDDTPLHNSCINGHYEVTKLLLKHDARVNLAGDDNDTPLHNACFNGHIDVARLLLEHGADVNLANEDNDTPLTLAANDGSVEIVQLLIEYKSNINHAGYDDETPLHNACKNGHFDVVQLLLTHGADAHKKDLVRNTALQIAYEKGHVNIAKLFLKKAKTTCQNKRQTARKNVCDK